MANDAFQKIKSSLNRGVTAISLKTSSSLEKAKIKTHIESIKSEIEKAISAVGQAAYTRWENGETDFSVLNEQFAQIKQKKEEIVALESECAAIDERDSQILGTAGGDTAAPESGGTICPSCGSIYSTPVKFCRKCGQKLAE